MKYQRTAEVFRRSSARAALSRATLIIAAGLFVGAPAAAQTVSGAGGGDVYGDAVGAGGTGVNGASGGDGVANGVFSNVGTGGGGGGAGGGTGGAGGGTGGGAGGAAGADGANGAGQAGGGGGGGGLNGQTTSALSNVGALTGGSGGNGGSQPLHALGGINASGGGGGGAGGYGAVVTGSGASANGGTIAGGAGGAGGNGNTGGQGGGGGGGVYFSATNAGFTSQTGGLVSGGVGGVGGGGGYAVSDGGGAGGANGDGGAGGVGVYFALSGGSVVNQSGATIQGGAGGQGGRFLAGGNTFVGTGGVGGAGVSLTQGSIDNSGTISGGAGGAGAAAGPSGGSGGNGGLGGAGVAATNSTIVNRSGGAISGGAGGAAGLGQTTIYFPGFDGATGAGGYGVTGSNLSVTTAGAIKGGLSGDGATRADAVHFTGGSNTLELQSGYSFLGNVVGAGSDTLRLGGSTSSSFDVSALGVAYTGFSTFEKVGTSTWMLTGTSAYTGQTLVSAGVLRVDGSLANASLTSVANGATLMGLGTVGSVSVASGGTFAPGAGTPGGVMTVSGDLTFNAGAIYALSVNSTTTTSTAVTGQATLTGAQATVSFATGSYVGRQYTILTATSGLNGTRFSSFTTTLAPSGFRTNLSYDATTVYLNLTADLGAIGGPLPRNGYKVANGLNAYFNAGGSLPPTFVAVFNLSGAPLANALAALSGESTTGAQRNAVQAADRFLEAMLDPSAPGREDDAAPLAGGAASSPLAYAPGSAMRHAPPALALAGALRAPAPPAAPAPQWRAWAQSFGGYARLAGDAGFTGSHDLTTHVAGVATGLDYRLAPGTTLGFALAGGGAGWGASQGLGGGRSDFMQAGVYGTTRLGGAYVSGALAFANHWNRTQRVVLGDSLEGNFLSQGYGGRLESGYRIATFFGGVAPYLAVQGQTVVAPAFREQDLTLGGFALNYRGHTSSDARGEIGARFDSVVAQFGDAALLLRGRAAYLHDWASDATLTAAFSALPGSDFPVEGAKPVKNAALVSAGAELRIAAGAALFAKFDGEFAPREQGYLASAGFKYSW